MSLRAFINSPTGPKTTHFWGPVFYVLYLKYFLQESFQQHIAMIIFGSLLIITGVQLFTFGLIGEIIVNKNQKTKNFIKEIIE